MASNFNAAWSAALTQKDIKHCFEGCAIFPVNQDTFPRSAHSLAFRDPAAVGTGSAPAGVSGVNAIESVSEVSAPSATVENSQASEGAHAVLRAEAVLQH